MILEPKKVRSVQFCSVQLSSVQSLSRVRLFVTPMDCSMPGFPVLHHLPEFDLLSRFYCWTSVHCCCCSVAKPCPTLCDPMDCSTPGFPVLHHLPEFAQTHVHWVNDAIWPSHPLSPTSLFAFNLSQHQSLFQWVGSLHQVAKVLELQHQSFQWIFRVAFL